MGKIDGVVVGSGGREHALLWKLRQSRLFNRLYCAPGNAGTATMPGCTNVDISVSDVAGMLEFVRREDVRFALIGPEAPLVEGAVVDEWLTLGSDFRIWGPKQYPAMLEASKDFAKKKMDQHRIPTAQWQAFERPSDALVWLELQVSFNWVVKGDGLAGGKAVIVCHTKSQIKAAIAEMATFGEAGKRFITEECLFGREASLFLMVDALGRIVPLETAQDYKCVGEGDTGVNTGGMGSFSPASHLNTKMITEIIEKLRPLIADVEFSGFLYVGLMLVGDEWYVLEFNVRMGDPETQVVIPRLKSDLGEVLWMMAGNEPGDVNLEWTDDVAVTVVMASKGYPGDYEVGNIITGLDQVDKEGIIFHAGTKMIGGQIVTAGGRVLDVTALGPDLKTARGRVYRNLHRISWEGGAYSRPDIAVQY